MNNLQIAQRIIDIAIQKNLKISFAESCTGGLVSSKITDIAGSSQVFVGSVISYSNSVKEEILNVRPKVIKTYGAVSLEVAREMAYGVLKLLKTDYAVSLSGIAGPLGGSKDKPVGTVAIALAKKNEEIARFFHFEGTRQKLKEQFAHAALELLLKELEQSSL